MIGTWKGRKGKCKARCLQSLLKYFWAFMTLKYPQHWIGSWTAFNVRKIFLCSQLAFAMEQTALVSLKSPPFSCRSQISSVHHWPVGKLPSDQVIQDSHLQVCGLAAVSLGGGSLSSSRWSFIPQQAGWLIVMLVSGLQAHWERMSLSGGSLCVMFAETPLVTAGHVAKPGVSLCERGLPRTWTHLENGCSLFLRSRPSFFSLPFLEKEMPPCLLKQTPVCPPIPSFSSCKSQPGSHQVSCPCFHFFPTSLKLLSLSLLIVMETQSQGPRITP